MIISSDKNNTVKLVRSLKLRKNREETGLFFVEGERGVTEGIKAKTPLRNLILSETFAESCEFESLKKQIGSVQGKDMESILIVVKDSIFSSISETPAPAGICGIFAMRKAKERIEEEIKPEYTKAVLLENLQDPGNMGTIIRTADAAGFDCVICTEGCVDVYNPKVLRSTVGSVFRIDVIVTDKKGSEVAEILKKKDFTVCAAEPEGGKCCFDEDFTGKNVLVIGNEANGISDEMLAVCDKKLTIPMPGGTESLNASVAAALLMYEILRKQEEYRK